MVAGYIRAEPKGNWKNRSVGGSRCNESGDDRGSEGYNIDTIYNLAACCLLWQSETKLGGKSVSTDYGMYSSGPRKQMRRVSLRGFDRFVGSLHLACRAPQDTIQRPRTMYGISKVTTELLSDILFNKYGDRYTCVRFRSFQMSLREVVRLTTQ